jgi:hypothetical protein
VQGPQLPPVNIEKSIKSNGNPWLSLGNDLEMMDFHGFSDYLW